MIRIRSTLSLYRLLCCAAGWIFAAGCSTTRLLPEGEVLYTGVEKIRIELPKGVKLTGEENSAITDPVKVPPNNPLYAPYLRTPLPTGLWVYNWNLREGGKGVGGWIYRRLAKKPVLLSAVNPELRTRIVENAAFDHGFFGAEATYEVLPHKRNPKKAKISYRVALPAPYRIGLAELWEWPAGLDSLIRRTEAESVIVPGENYHVSRLEEERSRIVSLVRNRGYYYFESDYIGFQADTTLLPGKQVALRTALMAGTPPMALKPYRIRNISLYLGDPAAGMTDSLTYQGITLTHYGDSKLRKKVARRAVGYEEGILYTLRRQEQTQVNLSRLGVFSSLQTELKPVEGGGDSSHGLLDVNIYARYDLPIELEVETDLSTKSNNLAGPGVTLTLTQKNLFRGGERLSFKLNGAYEWQTQGKHQNSSGLINSWEAGLQVGLSVPWLVVPDRWMNRRYTNERTQFQLGVGIMNRNSFFRMLSFNAGVTYDFRSGPRHTHSISPLKVNYTYLLETSEAFDREMEAYPAIRLSFENQFIPALSYTYTYDRVSRRIKNRRLFWQATVTSSGNLLSGIQRLTGNKEKQNREIFGNIYSQFAKLYSQLIVYRPLSHNSYLAGRLIAGAGYAYGNSRIMPYSEQFYTGGANSIRAFTIRTLGPGSYRPPADKKTGYLDQTGDFRLEANLEYRLNMTEALSGALFLDAGNIWLLRDDPGRPGGTLGSGAFLKQVALGSGVGIRYDLTYLVIRLDLGVALHTPYANPDRRGYFNVSGNDRTALHLAIGVPF